MMQNAFLDKSLEFAGKVQHQLVDNLHMSNRGVKQAGFLVLYKTAMPGVLIETGFISNSKDEKFLLSEKGQDQMAEAIFKAFRDYKNHIENKVAEQDNTDTLILENQLPVSDAANAKNIKKTEAKPVSKKEPETAEISFRVQFALFPDAKPVDSKIFNGIEDVKMYFHGGAYKYTSGDFKSMEEALVLRKEMIAKGYKDAFVVAFNGKDRITNDEAKRLSGKKY
jgi:N-acetylmuramoyl-L-alanine amidase